MEYRQAVCLISFSCCFVSVAIASLVFSGSCGWGCLGIWGNFDTYADDFGVCDSFRQFPVCVCCALVLDLRIVVAFVMAIIVAVAAALLLWLGVASSDLAITAVAFVALHIAIAVLLQGRRMRAVTCGLSLVSISKDTF